MEASTTLWVGDARIDRIVDLADFRIPLLGIFPDVDLATLERARSWLEPRYLSDSTVRLSIHSLLLRCAGQNILVDTCVGEHKPRPKQASWDNRRASAYLADLARHGLGLDDIDVVFCTHLHVDHVGWNTRLVDGRWIPTFPNATYLIGRAELAHWQQEIGSGAVGINHGSYTDSVLPILSAGQERLVDADHALFEGCHVCALPGHTPGQLGLRLESGPARALFVGDAIHHPLQLAQPDLSSGLCADKAMARRTRQAFLEECADSDTWLVPMHFRGDTGVRIRAEASGFRIRS